MFVGHDHDNDYAVMWKGILLAYGLFTGGNTEYLSLIHIYWQIGTFFCFENYYSFK